MKKFKEQVIDHDVLVVNYKTELQARDHPPWHPVGTITHHSEKNSLQSFKSQYIVGFSKDISWSSTPEDPSLGSQRTEALFNTSLLRRNKCLLRRPNIRQEPKTSPPGAKSKTFFSPNSLTNYSSHKQLNLGVPTRREKSPNPKIIFQNQPREENLSPPTSIISHLKDCMMQSLNLEMTLAAWRAFPSRCRPQNTIPGPKGLLSPCRNSCTW